MKKEEIKTRNSTLLAKNKLKTEIEASEYAESIINTVREPLLVLNQDLRVIKASRSFYDFFKVAPDETIGTLIYNLGNNQWDIPKLRELLETILPEKTTFNNFEVEHSFSTIGKRIMLLNARQIERAFGKEKVILLAIEDITERKSIEAGLDKTRKELAVIKISADEVSEFAENLIDTVREPLLVLNQDLRVVKASRSFYDFFKVAPDETIGTLIYDLGNEQWNIPKLRELLETILPEKTTFDNYEVEHDFATIGKRIMLLNARQIERALGKEKVILLSIEDITEHKLLENLMTESEERFRRIFETADDGILLLDKDEFKIHYANASVTRMLDYTIEECIGKELKDIGFPENLNTLQEILMTLDKNGIVNYRDSVLHKKTGKFVDTDIYMVDKTNLIQCNIRDITDRKEAEEALGASEKRYRNIFENTGTATVIVEENLIISLANKGFADLSGYSCEEIEGQKKWIDFVVPEDLEMMKEQHKLRRKKVNLALKGYEFKFINKDKKIRNILLSVDIVPGTKKSVASLIDITERKQMEEALRERMKELNCFFEISNLVQTPGISDDDFFQGVLDVIHPAFRYPELTVCRLIINEKEYKTRNFKKTNWNICEDIIVDKSISGSIEVCLLKKISDLDSTQFLKEEKDLIKSIAERLGQVLGHKKADKELIESEQKMRSIMENSADAIFITDENGKYTYTNKEVTALLGYTKEEMKSKTIIDMAPQHRVNEYLEIFKSLKTKGKFITEIELLKNDGTYIQTDLNAVILPDGNVYSSCRDITERKRSEKIQETLFNISKALNTMDDLPLLFDEIKGFLGNVIDTTNFYIALYDNESETISLPYARDEKDVFETFPAGKTLTGYVIKSRKPLYATRSVQDKLTAEGEIELLGTPSEIWLGVPMMIENNVIGLIAVQSYTDPNLYTEKDIEILSFISEEIALAIWHKQAEDQIKKDLDIKTALLQEIYHRTKNNMQVIVSMLKMQSRRTDSDYLKTSFKEIVNKINAMSLVHQKLYQAKDLSKINLKDYIDDLVHLLRMSYSLQAANVSLKLELDDAYVLIDSAVPLGLVLNELISNIFKHAFPNKGTGEISIRMYQEENGFINIHLEDNGIGIPTDLDLRKSSSMGLETMFSLIDYQLRGKVTYRVDNGLKWHLKYSDEINKARV